MAQVQTTRREAVIVMPAYNLLIYCQYCQHILTKHVEFACCPHVCVGTQALSHSPKCLSVLTAQGVPCVSPYDSWDRLMNRIELDTQKKRDEHKLK